MNRKGLELLKQINLNEEGLSELLKNSTLPPKFLKFISLYKIGYQSFEFDKIMINDSIYPLTAMEMYENELMHGEEYYGCIDYILPYRQLLGEIDKYHKKVEKWNVKGFIQIGLMGHADVLLLGVESNNNDEIWRYGQGLINTVHSKLEDDIFAFFMRAKEVLLLEDFEQWEIRSSNIYKNLGENFWRVRETKEES